MADVRAFRSGNWSDVTATSPWWNGTAIFAPAAGDNVYSNNFTVTVDVSVNLAASSTITNGSATSRTWKDGGTSIATAGGGYNLNNGVTLTANILGGIAGTAGISISGTASASIVGNITGGPTTSMYGCQNSSSGTLSVTGNISSSGSFGTAYALYVTGSGITNITGNCSAAGYAPAVYNNTSGSGTVNITGNVTGGTISTAIGAVNVTTGTILITGNVTAGAVGVGANNASTGAFTVIGDITASTGANAFTSSSTSATNRLSGSFINSANGTAAVYAAKYILNSTPLLAKTRYAKDGISQYVDMFTSDNNPNGGVATTDVRLGVSYGGGLVGTCAVPNAGTVAFGVAVDNTTGTATLTAANLRAALGLASANLDAQLAVLSNLDTTVSSRLAPSGTLATVTTLTNAPASVTPAQIRQEMDSNSTKLANLDASVSSRLATSGYTAPSTAPTVAAIRAEMDSNSTKLANLDASVSSRLASSAYSAAPTTAQIATAVEGSLLNEADGQAVLNAIVGAIGNTNVSEVSLVAAIRTDLERVGGKIDSIPAAPTAAANATAVWSAATKTITGGTVDTLTNAPTVPTASAIASQVRTELATELARVDAAVSTRLATSGYTAPSSAPTAVANASAVRTELATELAKVAALNTDRLANVATTAIVGNLIAQANS